MMNMVWRDGGVPADSFYEARTECAEGPKSKFKIKAGKTLSVRRWQAAFSPEGHLDIASVLSRIQRGGVHPSIRGEVWEFLLGCFDPKSTLDEREELRQQRREQYERWKDVCHELDSHVGSGIIVTAPLVTEDGQPIHDPLVLMEASPSQTPPRSEQVDSSAESTDIMMDKQVINWKLTLHQIDEKFRLTEKTIKKLFSQLLERCVVAEQFLNNGLDVLRTDRGLVFYEKKENLSKLWDILAVYAWIDKDVGYCQGMSDLCSPLIILLEDEADAFWCFERLMRKLRGNFRCTESSVGVENQLQSLASITQILDPKLHQHIEELGGGDYLFAVRMFMVMFRRELSFGDSLYLWEMTWALEYHPDIFTLYEEPEFLEQNDGSKKKVKIRQFGKFERDNIRNGTKTSEAPLPITVFLVASVLKDKSAKILQEARGLDDVVKILNEISDLDAKKACSHAIKLHKKYLKMAKNS